MRKLAAAGVSARDAKKVLPEGTLGFSSSNYSRLLGTEGEQSLAELHSRRFDDGEHEPIVAAYADAAAIGTRGKKRAVTIVVGITADGRKLGLGAAVTPWERADDIYPLFEGIVKRGVDPGILWIADQGAGIRTALEKLTHPKPPVLQLCTTHAAGNVVKSLPEEMQEAVRLRLYGAWKRDDADAALAKLGAIATELEAEGHKEAANSLRGSMDGTVTVQRLGLEGDVRKQLRSTNAMESVNSGVKAKGSMSNVTLWRDDAMRLRWVAQRLLELEEMSWTRLAEPQQLVGLMERLTPRRHDPEAILAKLPPSLSVARLPVSFGADGRAEELARGWCDANPGATWIGSPETLKALGLGAEVEPTPERLLTALRCRDPDTGANLRRLSRVSVPGLDAEGKAVKETVDGILDLEWELVASPAAMREWQQGGAAAEQVEARMVAAAGAAVERATLTTEPHHGFAGIMALRRPSAEEPERPLSVAGITFAVQRGKAARLGSPASEEMLRSKTARTAEDAAKAVLEGKPLEAPAPDPAPERDASRPTSPALPPPSEALLAGVEARALELAPRMVAGEPEDLGALAGGLAEAGEGLGAIAGEVDDWREQSWQGAVRQLAAAHARPQPSSGPRQDVWAPLSPGQRLVLGEAHSQWLLGNAAMLAGFAEVDAEAARGLSEASEEPLAGLQQPVARAEAAARALAAQRELERRQVFEAAREETGPAPPPLELRDARGELGASPADRYGRALGARRAAAVKRCSGAVAKEMGGMDEEAVRRLAAETAGTWSGLDARAGMELVGLERDRDVALGDRLQALREFGRETATMQQAERRHDASALFVADDRAAVAKDRAHQGWVSLRELEPRVSYLRRSSDSPDWLARHPAAAVHDAAHAELLRRERQREQALPTVTQTPAREAAGRDI